MSKRDFGTTYVGTNLLTLKKLSDQLCIAILMSFLSWCVTPKAYADSPSLMISQFPLELAAPTNPQVLIAIGNSESMDGSLSGAIMVGSGSIGSDLSSLSYSSSPLTYAVPSGFAPPIQAADIAGYAPYTVTQDGNLMDNGPSRLNVAKAGVRAILEAYMPNTDFGLITYNTSGTSKYTTWVYYMSPANEGFTFTNTPMSGNRYVTNPCYLYSAASNTVKSNCTSMASLYGASTLSSNQYMKIGASSDDPNINDVLYAGGKPGIFVTYSSPTAGPSPATPYPPNFSISNYNNNNVLLSYNRTNPNIGRFATGPTNAGFVPYSTEVLYSQRGFGYWGNPSATTGLIKVPMTTAGPNITTASINTAISSFTPYLKPETSNSSTTEIKALAGQSPIAGLLTTAKTYLSSVPITTAGCIPKQYVILISDGLPTLDLAGKAWPPLGSAAATGYGVTATFHADGTLNTSNNQAVTDTMSALSDLWLTNVKTFVIGLGAGVDPSQNPLAASTLTAMALAGHTINYYPASSPSALVNYLNAILVSLQNESLSGSAASLSSTHLQTDSKEFQTSFNGNDSPYQDWTGNIVAKALSATTGTPVGSTIWSAQTLLDAQSTRLIATWNHALDNNAGGGAPFQWDTISAEQQALLQPADELGSSRLSYLRGVTSSEKRNGGSFRNRSHILGDLVSSKPTYVGPPANTSLFFSSSSYVHFVLSHTNRPAMLYAGANDGMLHAFLASTGGEQFAFIPNGVFSNLYQLTDPLYNQNHLYYVDGSPQSGDVQFSDGTWHTLLVGGEGGGGKTIYALDITDPSSLTSETLVANTVLWEFSDPDMGLSYSQPQIAQINSISSTNLSFAIFFGNGYNSPSNKTILYAVDPQSGQTVAKIDLCSEVPGSCDATKPNGLSTIAMGQSDGLLGKPMTHIYAGDLQGNLWAIDVSNPSPASWQARLLFQARDPLGNAQPITMPPLITLNPSYPRYQGLFIMFGTGQLLTSSDLTSNQTQSIYGVWDKPALNTVIQRSHLQAQTLTVVPSEAADLPQDILTATSLSISWGTNYGWYADLPISGQRVITKPILLNGSFITTLNTPATTECGAATSMLLDINYQTGGAFSTPQLDIDASGSIGSNDLYNGKSPVGIGLLSGYASAPTHVGVNSNNYMTQLITMSSGQQISAINPNNNSRQTGWWQLQ